MNFECPSCARKTTAAEVENMELGMLTCLDCNTRYHLLGYDVDEQDRSYKDIPNLPKGIGLQQRPTGTRIVLKESKGRALAVIWAIIVCGITTLILSTPQPNTSENTVVGWLVAVAIIASVPFSIYRTFRRRFLEILPTKIRFGYDLFGWLSFLKVYQIAEFEQFFVKKHLTKKGGNENYTAVYSLNALDREQKVIRLLKDIRGFNEAFFIEQELEDFYGIVDVRLFGEFDPRKELAGDFNLGDSYIFVKNILKNTKEEYEREGVAKAKTKNIYKDNLEMLVKKIMEAKHYRAY